MKVLFSSLKLLSDQISDVIALEKYDCTRIRLSAQCIFQICVLKAEAIRSISFLVIPCRAASLRHFDTVLPTCAAISRALSVSSSKYLATDIARAREAVPSSSLIAVVRMRGFMSVGTG